MDSPLFLLLHLLNGFDGIHQDIDKSFLNVLKNNTAGDPMSEDIKWTNLTHIKIAELLAEQHHVKVSTKVIRQLLKKHNYRRRKIQKKNNYERSQK